MTCLKVWPNNVSGVQKHFWGQKRHKNCHTFVQILNPKSSIQRFGQKADMIIIGSRADAIMQIYDTMKPS